MSIRRQGLRPDVPFSDLAISSTENQAEWGRVSREQEHLRIKAPLILWLVLLISPGSDSGS